MVFPGPLASSLPTTNGHPTTQTGGPPNQGGLAREILGSSEEPPAAQPEWPSLWGVFPGRGAHCS